MGNGRARTNQPSNLRVLQRWLDGEAKQFRCQYARLKHPREGAGASNTAKWHGTQHIQERRRDNDHATSECRYHSATNGQMSRVPDGRVTASFVTISLFPISRFHTTTSSGPQAESVGSQTHGSIQHSGSQARLPLGREITSTPALRLRKAVGYAARASSSQQLLADGRHGSFSNSWGQSQQLQRACVANSLNKRGWEAGFLGDDRRRDLRADI